MFILKVSKVPNGNARPTVCSEKDEAKKALTIYLALSCSSWDIFWFGFGVGLGFGDKPSGHPGCSPTSFVAKTDLEFLRPLPRPPKCWSHRPVPPHPAQMHLYYISCVPFPQGWTEESSVNIRAGWKSYHTVHVHSTGTRWCPSHACMLRRPSKLPMRSCKICISRGGNGGSRPVLYCCSKIPVAKCL